MSAFWQSNQYFVHLQTIKIELPDFYDKEKQGARFEDLTPDEIRAKMKERGIAPPRLWNERQFDISCTSDVFEPYVPPEGDGKLSLVSVGVSFDSLVVLVML